LLREHLPDSLTGERDFRWRAGEITRLEGFSDAVFAFAVTLLVVSLEVPKSFHELMAAMRGFLAFGVCFALLADVWFNHYRFFRRYGVQTPWAIFLNCVLLFFVLFYVYPLKYLWFAIFSHGGQIEAHQARTLFMIYGSGYAAVFLVLALLYRHAWSKREELALNDLEKLKTRHSMIDHFAMVAVGLTSVLLAVVLPLQWIGLAGYFYFVIGIYFAAAGSIFGKKERLLQAANGAAVTAGSAQ
jgi:uncharacterized membrane protein